MTTTSHPVILIVDDAAENLHVLYELLRPQYRVLAANSGEGGLRVAHSEPTPDLILLDVMMPGMDGYAVLAQLREAPATCDIPVIFLTALADAGDEERGLQLGAADYITKPISPLVVLARVRTQLEAKQARDGLRSQNAFLEGEVARRMAENDLTQRVSIRALAHLAHRLCQLRLHGLQQTQHLGHLVPATHLDPGAEVTMGNSLGQAGRFSQ